ncbi:MAG: Gfo/Idh/MocA family oxidoreductase [Defluviitaleaceae bacterium]|nr:Gfo/Idh/MocA family oxidoreductase [Defluviitaleaceae bacterium]
MSKVVNIGLIGCGAISGIYLKNLQNVFLNTNIVAVADRIPERAKKASDEWGIKIQSNEELVNNPDIDIVLNLTTPDSHYIVNKAAIEAGKHAYTEKPLCSTFEEGKEIVSLAAKKGVMLGGAPDTFMGAGIQTCRKIIEDGYIGRVVGASAFYASRGHETWHPSPEFYYEKGGGPMFDMGPYYLTALINLIGQVDEVFGFATKGFDYRIISSEPKFGKRVDVEVPTTIQSLLKFSTGAVATIVTSFDFVAHSHPFLEIYGTEGSLLVPDPNYFEGPVKVCSRDEEGYKEMPLTHSYKENMRGLGVADMAQCIIDGRTDARASHNVNYHVLEVMEAVHTAGATGKVYKMQTKFEKPKLMPIGLVKGTLDLYS